MKPIFMILFFLFVSGFAFAGDIEFTGRATILKDDLRAAQKNSLNNALTGAIKKYLQVYAPQRKADITHDYFIFIEDYMILQRELINNTVVTKVYVNIDDTILEDVATYITKQVNTAVFLISGLPDYVPDDKTRQLLSTIFSEHQFSTKEQIPFEQELIDRNSRADIQNAFQSVSSQYLFMIKISVLSYKAGESCTIQSDSSYISANKLYMNEPIIKTKITAEADDPQDCVLLALNYAVESALEHVRQKQIPSPGVQAELLKYNILFEGTSDLKLINGIMDSLAKGRFIKNFNLDEFFDNTAVFEVETYFLPEDLAKKITSLELPEDTSLEVSGDISIIFGISK